MVLEVSFIGIYVYLIAGDLNIKNKKGRNSIHIVTVFLSVTCTLEDLDSRGCTRHNSSNSVPASKRSS